MDILITGNLSSLTTAFVKELSKQKHRLVLASDNPDQFGIKAKNTIVHPINPASDLFRDAMFSYGFDIVIFISTREEQLWEENDFETGHQLDALRNTLEIGKRGKLKHFFYISSTEVYGNSDDLSEKTIPQPASLNGYTLFTGEQYCRFYHDMFGMNTTILRLTNVYGPDEKSGLLYRLLTSCNAKNEATFPACEKKEVSLLHVLDITDFIIRAMDEQYTPDVLAVNLSCTNPIQYSELAQMLHNHYPEAVLKFQEEEYLYTKPAKISAASRIYDWVDTHTIENELEKVVDALQGKGVVARSGLEVMKGKLSNYPELLKWVELLGGVALTQFLSQMTGTLIQFKYVDFRLLFVVIMGSIYGIRTGLYAAALVSIAILYTWIQLGFDWALLIYNVGNWLPFALYFMAGMITGYNRDQNENQVLNAQKQATLIYDKYTFLYGVFNDVRKLKDEFRERLLGYRDSFGKIFTITRELDQLQEQAVFFRALSILEEHLDSKNVAIYSLGGDRTRARLEANSTALNTKLAKSLDLVDFPELTSYIEHGTIFQNTGLLPNYPAYVVPIFNNGYPFNVPAAIIVIWAVKFGQYSTYYSNMLKVICGLIQASLVRATLFSNANYEKMYLPTTRILNCQAFMDALKVRVEMKKNRISDFQLIVVESPGNNYEDIYSCISERVRTTDIIGMHNKGEYYIVLSQADKLAAEYVVQRLGSLGIPGRLVDVNQISSD